MFIVTEYAALSFSCETIKYMIIIQPVIEEGQSQIR